MLSVSQGYICTSPYKLLKFCLETEPKKTSIWLIYKLIATLPKSGEIRFVYSFWVGQVHLRHAIKTIFSMKMPFRQVFWKV
jgi:hypothetical protein